MAKKFTHAEVIGIDLAPVPIDPNTLPSNCQFKIEDVQQGLPHFQNQFDLVHARYMVAGLKDFRKSMADAYNCLKPGGILICMEPDVDWFTPHIHQCRPVASDTNPTGTWLGRLMFGMFPI